MPWVHARLRLMLRRPWTRACLGLLYLAIFLYMCYGGRFEVGIQIAPDALQAGTDPEEGWQSRLESLRNMSVAVFEDTPYHDGKLVRAYLVREAVDLW